MSARAVVGYFALDWERSGDLLKSAFDLQRPLHGVGLMSREGTAPGDRLVPLDAEITVTVAGQPVVCDAYQLERFCAAPLYLLAPRDPGDQWIVRRLRGGGAFDRLAQEQLLGVGGVRLLRALGVEVDVYHLQGGAGACAALELLRMWLAAGSSLAEAITAVRRRVIFDLHAADTSTPAALSRALAADLGVDGRIVAALGGEPLSLTAVGLRLARACAVPSPAAAAALGPELARVADRPPLVVVPGGAHALTWQDARVRAACVREKSPARRRAELWRVRQTLRAELQAELGAATGEWIDLDRPIVGAIGACVPDETRLRAQGAQLVQLPGDADWFLQRALVRGADAWLVGAGDDPWALRAALNAAVPIAADDPLAPAYAQPARWQTMIEAVVEAAGWRGSTDRVLEDCYEQLYEPHAHAERARATG